MAETFISYSSLDFDVARQVCAALEARGLRCFMAPRDIGVGEVWSARLMRALREARAVVLILSQHSNRSRQVLCEVQNAVQFGCDLAPYRIDDVVPTDALGYFIGIHHWGAVVRSVDPQSIDELVRALTAPVPDLTFAARRSAPPSATSVELLDAVRQRLGEALVRARDTIVAIESPSDAERQGLRALIARGELREVRSLAQPDVLRVAFRRPRDCFLAMANYLEHLPAPRWEEVISRADNFKPLADAIGAYLAARFRRGESQLLPLLTSRSQRAAARLLCELAPPACDFDPLIGPAQGGDENELTGLNFLDAHDSRNAPVAASPACAASALSAVEQLCAGGSLPALRGCAHYAQLLLDDSRQHALAEQVLAKVAESSPGQASQRELRHFQAELNNDVARLLRRCGQWARAEEHARRAIELAESLGDDVLAGICTNNLARVLLESGGGDNNEGARAIAAMLQQNIARLQRPEQREQLAVTYHNLAAAHGPHNSELAEHYYRRDCELCREHGEPLPLIDALDGLGVFYSQRERFEEAAATHCEELRLLDSVFDFRRAARAHANLGRAEYGLARQRGDRAQLDSACRRLQEARRLFARIDEPRLFAPALETLGRATFAAGREGEALECLHAACEQYERWPEGRPVAAAIRAEVAAVMPQLCQE